MNIPSTTFRGYCLFVLANNNLTNKKAQKHQAYLALKANQNLETADAFLKADKEVDEAEKQLEQARMLQKHNRRIQ